MSGDTTNRAQSQRVDDAAESDASLPHLTGDDCAVEKRSWTLSPEAWLADLNPARLAELGLPADYALRRHRKDLLACNLDQSNLRGADLSHFDLKDALLRGADLRGANLRGANMRGADLAGADLWLADLADANVGPEQVTAARNWIMARLGPELLEALRLPSDHDVKIEQKDFSRYNLSNLSLAGSDLSKALLREANLTGAILKCVNFTGADLEGSNVAGACFEGATITDEQILGTKNWFMAMYGDRPIDARLGLLADHDERVRTRNFSGASLEGRDLRDNDLSNLNLSKANLNRAVLSKVDLTGTDLTGAHMNGARLDGAKLAGTQMKDTELHGAWLIKVELKDAEGLVAGQLSGTNVTGASLPKDIGEFKTLLAASEAAKNSRTALVTACFACISSWFAMGLTTDAALIGGSGTLSLPAIQASVSSLAFYAVAPLILFGFQLYLALAVGNVFKLLAMQPAILPDGCPLHDIVRPWLFNSLVRTRFSFFAKDSNATEQFEVLAWTVVVWGTVPLTLLCFWWRVLVRRDAVVTLEESLLALASAVLAIVAIRSSQRTLRDGLGIPEMKHLTKLRAVVLPVILAIVIILISFQFVDPSNADVWHRLASRLKIDRLPDLRNAELSVRPPGWSGTVDEIAKPGSLSRRDLHGAQALGLFAVRADMRQANLRAAVLSFGDLRRAVLANADLRLAQLDHADLREADLKSADLRGASLERANLQGSQLHRARVNRNDLGRSDNWILAYGVGELVYGDNAKADSDVNDYDRRVRYRDFMGLRFSEIGILVSLEHAELSRANLQYSGLEGISLTGSNLQGADLRHANLLHADLLDADLKGADLRGVDLSRTRGLNAAQLRLAMLDESTIWPTSISGSSH